MLLLCHEPFLFFFSFEINNWIEIEIDQDGYCPFVVVVVIIFFFFLEWKVKGLWNFNFRRNSCVISFPLRRGIGTSRSRVARGEFLAVPDAR